jgi:tetratricopeptide (TPR) repeat protein
MKKIVLGILSTWFVIASFGQATVVSAFTYLKNGQLDKAKNQIDMAMKDEKAKGLAKTWFYRGNIYLQIHLSALPKYKVLDTNALQTAYDAYQKAIEIDKEVMNESINPMSPMLGLYVVGEQFYNKGVDAYNLKKYSDAMSNFEMTRKINGAFGAKDTVATFNAALCAVQLNDNKKAKQYFEELAKNQYHQGMIYSSLANIYKSEGDTVKALNMIVKGRKLMPEDLTLIIAETNIYLAQGKSKEAQDLLALAVSKDPNNQLLHYAIGVNMAEFGNFTEAEKSYNKALELKPDYFDALYNLGALYVNTAASTMEEANKLDIKETEKYNILKAKADELLNKAIPVLEKAESINPTDMNTLYSLKQLYTRVGNVDKMKTIDEKIKNMKK